jgi:protein-L-isoaspartate(D-aspartate) O-methyltransferase
VLITAAGPEVPQALIEQVKDGGRIVAPIGDDQSQELRVYTKRGKRLSMKRMGDCFFVPLIGKYGVPEGE